MVAERIETGRRYDDGRGNTDRNKLIVAFGIIATLLGGYVHWQNGQTIQHIDLRLQPLALAVAENTESRKKGGRYTDNDATRDFAQIRQEISTCKNGRKEEDARLHIRIDQLFQKMFEFHSAHAHDLLMNNRNTDTE